MSHPRNVEDGWVIDKCDVAARGLFSLDAATLGRILISQGRPDAAAELLEPVVAALRAVLGDAHQATMVALNNYGKALTLLQRSGEARPLLEEAVRGQRQKKIARDWLLARFALNLADACVALGDNAAARRLVAEDLSWLLDQSGQPLLVGQKAEDHARLKALAARLGA